MAFGPKLYSSEGLDIFKRLGMNPQSVTLVTPGWHAPKIRRGLEPPYATKVNFWAQAGAILALPPTIIPIPKCLHDFLTDIGVDIFNSTVDLVLPAPDSIHPCHVIKIIVQVF